MPKKRETDGHSVYGRKLMEDSMAMATGTVATSRASEATRWGQLIFGIICMVMIANLQYGWTLFVNPIDQKFHWGRAAIQVAFTIFVLTETWLVPFEGYLIDKFGPKIMISGSGVLVAIAWVVNSMADSLFLLYVGAAIGGIGAGVIYGGSLRVLRRRALALARRSPSSPSPA
jgi:MFS family permease